MANLVSRDLRSVTGRNLRMLRDETGLDPWRVSSKVMKKVLADGYGQVPDVDRWRLPYLSKLIDQRQMAYYSGCVEEEKRLAGLIDSVCIN